MRLVTFAPQVCLSKKLVGCEGLIAYARFANQQQVKDEAFAQVITTFFTIAVLAAAFLSF